MQIWSLKICFHDISKTIIARSFKLGQHEEIFRVIFFLNCYFFTFLFIFFFLGGGGGGKIPAVLFEYFDTAFKKKVILFFSNYLPLQIWTLKICVHDISKSITARGFKLGPLIEDDK